MSPSGAWASKKARCSLEKSFRIDALPSAVSRIVAASARPFSDAEQTYPPGIASTSTLTVGERRISSGRSTGSTGRSLTTVSPARPCILRARATMPAALSSRSGVSKKKTCRICASSGSSPSATTAARWSDAGTVSLSSTLSDLRASSSMRTSSSSESRAGARWPSPDRSQARLRCRGAPLQLGGFGQLLQGAPPAGAPRSRVRDGRAVGRRSLEPRRRCSASSTPACAFRRSCSTTAARSPSRTRSSGTSATARSTSPTTRTSARRCCSGSSSSSTATSRTSPSRASGSRTRGTPERFEEQLPARMKGGYAALDAMERHLATRAFLVGERYSLADISLYAYTHVAHEGGFDLDPYPGDPRVARTRRDAARARHDRRVGRVGPRPLRAEPDRLAPPRQRADRGREPALRGCSRRRAGAADRRHGSRRAPSRAGRRRSSATSHGSASTFDEGPVRQSERGARLRGGRRRARLEGGGAERDDDGSVRLGRDGTTLLRADGTATYQLASVADDLDARDHARHPRQRPPAEPPGAAAHRAGARRRAARGDPPRARARPGREEALEAARSLLDRRAARRGIPCGGGARVPRRARSARARRPARPRRDCAGSRSTRSPRCPTRSSRPLPTRHVEVVPALRGARIARRGARVRAPRLDPQPIVPRRGCASPRSSGSPSSGPPPERLSLDEGKAIVRELKAVGGDLHSLRLALTGADRGPELAAVLAALSRDEALRRTA